jgi:hypothetical protein
LLFRNWAPVSAGLYGVEIREGNDANDQAMAAIDLYTPNRAFLLEGEIVRVQAMTTGGTTSNLFAKVKYARKD